MMMAFLLFLVLILGMMVVSRLLGLTLSGRTLATYSIFGALLGFLAIPFVSLLFAPYGEDWTYQRMLIAMGRQAVLVLPVISYLFVRRAYRVTSVADAFLLAFATGFGYDLATALLTSSSAGPVKGLSYFPPFQYAGSDYAVAGYGYWTGLVALALAAMLRFVRRRNLAVAVAAVVFLWVTAEQTSLFWRTGPESLFATFSNISFHGQLTAWVALIALVGLSIYEVNWLSRTGVDPDPKFQLMERSKELFQLLRQGHFREYARSSTFFALRRQLRIAQAERNLASGDKRLQRVVLHIEMRMRQVEAAGTAVRGKAARAAPRVAFWKDQRVRHATPWFALVILIFLFPELPPMVTNYFWTIQLLHLQLGEMPSLLNALLIVVLFWRYLASAGKPDSTADDMIRFQGEKGILWMGLSAILIVFVYGNLQTIYPFSNWLTSHTGASLPNFDLVQLPTVLLLFATAGTGLTLERAARWQQAPLEDRRAAAIRKALAFASVFAVVWICVAVYTPGVQEFHRRFGDTIFEQAKQVSPANTGSVGNYGAATVVTLLTAAFAWGVYWLLGFWTKRIEKFLLGK